MLFYELARRTKQEINFHHQITLGSISGGISDVVEFVYDQRICAQFARYNLHEPIAVYEQVPSHEKRFWEGKSTILKSLCDARLGGPVDEKRFWEGKSTILQSLCDAHTLELSASQLLAPNFEAPSSLYTNFRNARRAFVVERLYLLPPPYDPPVYDTTGVEQDFELEWRWETWTRADHAAILEYTQTLTGQKVTSLRRLMRPLDFCHGLWLRHWYRTFAYQEKMVFSAIHQHMLPDLVKGIRPYMEDARILVEKKSADLSPRLLKAYALYIFRDRLVRDSLPADIKDLSLLDSGYNARYYSNPSIHWSSRMDALRSAAHPKDRARKLTRHDLGMFVESEAFRLSMTEALFLAYEYRYCEVYNTSGLYLWKSFIEYYDIFWVAELMVREHEHLQSLALGTEAHRDG